jgi:hypothetical protein
MLSFRLSPDAPNAAAIVTEESSERRTAFLPECVTPRHSGLLIACNIRRWQSEPLPPILNRLPR